MNQLQTPSRLLSVVRTILRPLVHLLLRYQVTFPVLMPILKQLYVDVAEQDFPIDGKKQTESRLSLLTGIHRKDVKRLRQQAAEHIEVPVSVSLGGQMVAYWLSTPGYQKKGKPQPLLRQSQTPGDISFETLVETVGRQDIRPRAVLDEWLRLGVVRVVGTSDRDDHIELCNEAFIPRDGEDEKLFYFGRNLSDHIKTGSHNLISNNNPWLERSVYYGSLSAEAVEELHQFYREQSMELLKKVNEKARELKQTSPGHCRMNAGVYYCQERNEENNED
ncbi:hypothetical protein A3759_10835 [Thalassolituus sp. HI0120]|nr:hypothetical protein A3759_10835 [Thalassolituus sp. HI0120]